MPGAATVDFYLGLGSRYSYLAASQVDRIEKTHGCRFVWKPIASGALMDRRGGNPFRGEPLSGQYDWGYREYDAKCWAAYYGIPFREPVAFRIDPDSAGAGLPGGRRAGRAGAVLPPAAAADLRRRRGDRRHVLADLATPLGLDAEPFSATSTRRRRASGTKGCWTRPRRAARSACRRSSSAIGCSGATTAWCCSRRRWAEGRC